MDETLQQQIDETKLELEEAKLQLTDKLGTLEQQVSETVESASTAVNATVEAVHETVESVTGAVEGAVHNMSNAFDLRRQIEKHPFLVVGGAAFIGYLAAEYFAKPPRKISRSLSPAAAGGEPVRTEDLQARPRPQAPPVPSPWESLKMTAVNTLLGSVQGIAMRAIPEAVGLLVGSMMGQRVQQERESSDRNAPQARMRSEKSQRFSSSPSSERVRAACDPE